MNAKTNRRHRDVQGAAAPRPSMPRKRTVADPMLQQSTLRSPLQGHTLRHPLQRHTLGVIQREAGGSTAHNAAIHRIAGAGLRGSSGSLPHLKTIQRSFGRHDVSGVKSHTGSAAVRANRAMRSEAYATGNHVAFKSSTPSLHTAAHESAHVIQQRAGVSLKAGVGQVGDKYERHADAVADAVVQGKSAEGVLDQMAGGGGVGRQATQLKEEQPAVPLKTLDVGNKSWEEFQALMKPWTLEPDTMTPKEIKAWGKGEKEGTWQTEYDKVENLFGGKKCLLEKELAKSGVSKGLDVAKWEEQTIESLRKIGESNVEGQVLDDQIIGQYFSELSDGEAQFYSPKQFDNHFSVGQVGERTEDLAPGLLKKHKQKGLHKKELNAIIGYTGPAYRLMNGQLRGIGDNPYGWNDTTMVKEDPDAAFPLAHWNAKWAPQVQIWIDRCLRGLSKTATPTKKEVYRGINRTDVAAQYKPRAKVPEPAFMSTSMNYDVSWKWAQGDEGGTFIKVKAGAKAPDINLMSMYEKEAEILFAPQEFLVVSKTKETYQKDGKDLPMHVVTLRQVNK